MYAIVDIETTGGHASANGITEIAIVLHDGKEVVQHYQTLINPGISIPIYISALTGISNEMVEQAPPFKQVAAEVFNLLQGRIFVAHNVNFDYSFIRHHLLLAGFDLQCKKLCTVRLGRKILPGYASYSLGKLCKCLNIEIEHRHRAAGDAHATAKLFTMLLEKDSDGHILQSLNRNSKEQQLPAHLNKADLDKLPLSPGIYYFNDQKGKAIYVGKAKNLRKRVLSHFTGNNSGRQRQEFMRHIHSITYQQCGTELMAFILEAAEIKRLWPANNRSLKRFDLAYGLYTYEDQNGYLRLMIDKKKKYSSPVYTFSQISEGHNLIQLLMKEHNLCPKLCFIQRNNDCCNGITHQHCFGACEGKESFEEYNKRVNAALISLKATLPTYAVMDEGRTEDESSLILMEEGQLKGMGYIPRNQALDDWDLLRPLLNPYISNDYIRNLIENFALRFPEKVIPVSI